MLGQVVGGAHPGAHIVDSFDLPTDSPSFGRADRLHPDSSQRFVRKLRIASVTRLAHVPIALVDRANRSVQIKFGSRRVHAGYGRTSETGVRLSHEEHDATVPRCPEFPYSAGISTEPVPTT